MILLKMGLMASLLAALLVVPCFYLCRCKRTWGLPVLFIVCFGLIPIVFLFYSILSIPANLPFWDDYNAIIQYVILSFPDRMQRLFSLHNQHRIVTVRLFLECMMAICGKVSFKMCMLVGSAQLLVIFACFCLLYIKQFGKCIGMILAFDSCWLIFSLQNFENAFWALTALQNFGVIMWAFLAIILFHFRNRRFFCVLSWLCAVAAILTSAQGLAVIVVFMLMLFLPSHDQCSDEERTTWASLMKQIITRLKNAYNVSGLLATICFIVVCSSIYLRGYVPGGVELRSASASLSDKLLYVLAFLGNPALLLPVALFIGFFVALAFVVVVISFPRLPILVRPLFFFSLFLIACDVAGVNFRAESPYAGVCYRYYIIVACLYVSLLGLLFSLFCTSGRTKFIAATVVSFCCVLVPLFFTLLFWVQLHERSESLRVNFLRWPHDINGLRNDEAALVDSSLALERMERLGLYDHNAVKRKDERLPESLLPWAELHFP